MFNGDFMKKYLYYIFDLWAWCVVTIGQKSIYDTFTFDKHLFIRFTMINPCFFLDTILHSASFCEETRATSSEDQWNQTETIDLWRHHRGHELRLDRCQSHFIEGAMCLFSIFVALAFFFSFVSLSPLSPSLSISLVNHDVTYHH